MSEELNKKILDIISFIEDDKNEYNESINSLKDSISDGYGDADDWSDLADKYEYFIDDVRYKLKELINDQT